MKGNRCAPAGALAGVPLNPVLTVLLLLLASALSCMQIVCISPCDSDFFQAFRPVGLMLHGPLLAPACVMSLSCLEQKADLVLCHNAHMSLMELGLLTLPAAEYVQQATREMPGYVCTELI